VPAVYMVGAATILVVLFLFQPTTTWPGLAIVALGVPVYFLIRMRQRKPTVAAVGPQTNSRS
ncbi:MAG: hypothetical protein WBD67_06130, partial [Terracidiphilus sp.]